MQESDDRRSTPSSWNKAKHQSSGGGVSDPSEKQTVVDLNSKPCKVAEIQLKGLKKTKPEIVHRELDPILKAQNLQEIYDEIQDLIPKLSALDVFSTMDVHITETKQVNNLSLFLTLFRMKLSGVGWNLSLLRSNLGMRKLRPLSKDQRLELKADLDSGMYVAEQRRSYFLWIMDHTKQWNLH